MYVLWRLSDMSHVLLRRSSDKSFRGHVWICNIFLFCQSPVLPSGSLPNTLPAGNINDGLIASSVPAPVIPDVGTDQCSSIRSGGSFIQPADFTPDSSLSGTQTFMPVFQTPLPLLQPATQQHQSPLPAVPLNSSLSSPPAAFAAPETQKFGLCESTVITHTASATLTHNAPATTFSQSQNLVLATQQPGAGVPCNLAFQTTVLQGQPRPQLLSQMTFALPKAVPLASAGTRPKQSQKIVPAPKPETVSLLLKNAFITPGEKHWWGDVFLFWVSLAGGRDLLAFLDLHNK